MSKDKIPKSSSCLVCKNRRSIQIKHWLMTKRIEAHLQTKDPLLINHNTVVEILILGHNLDIGQRRPHVLFEYRARSEHTILHIKGHPISIRKLFGPVSLLRLPTLGPQRASGAHSIRIEVSHYDRCRYSIFQRDCALASRRRFPTHRLESVKHEPTRRRWAPLGPWHLHGCGRLRNGDVTEGRTCAVRCRDVRKERLTVNDEWEKRLHRVAVVEGHPEIESNDRIFCLVTEWSIKRGCD